MTEQHASKLFVFVTESIGNVFLFEIYVSTCSKYLHIKQIFLILDVLQHIWIVSVNSKASIRKFLLKTEAFVCPGMWWVDTWTHGQPDPGQTKL